MAPKKLQLYIKINTNKTVGDIYNLIDTEKAYVEKFEKVWEDFFDKPTNHYINIIGRERGDTLKNWKIGKFSEGHNNGQPN